MTLQSTAKRLPYSASNALEAVGRALNEIKAADHLTWEDVGAELGKSDDQAAKYADGRATMDFITFGRARRKWGKRFTCYFDQLCGEGIGGIERDRHDMAHVAVAAARMAEALEDDGQIDAAEVRAAIKPLSAAFDAIGRQLQKVTCEDLIGGVQ